MLGVRLFYDLSGVILCEYVDEPYRQNLEPIRYPPTFLRFDTIQSCDGRTDGRTDRIPVANTTLSTAAHCKRLGGFHLIEKIVHNRVSYNSYFTNDMQMHFCCS